MDKMLELFGQRISQMGGWFARVVDNERAVSALKEAYPFDRRRIVISDRVAAIDDVYKKIGLSIGEICNDLIRKVLSESELGITSCDGLIAETGSAVLVNRTGEPRMLSLLPERHVVISNINNLYDSLDHYIADSGLKAMSGRAGALTIISGPSRTSDIEKTLITGVHGPRAFGVLVIG